MSGQTTSEYIQPPLDFPKHRGWISGTFTLDTLFFSIVCGSDFLVYLFSCCKKMLRPAYQAKLQCLVEIVVGWVDGIVKENFHGPRNVVIAPISFNHFRAGYSL